jgi:hypothetical protein
MNRSSATLAAAALSLFLARPPVVAGLTGISGVSGATASVQKKLEPFRPLRAVTPPVIDGLLDDSIWETAPFAKDFLTYHPDYGKPLGEDTTVWFAYDAENLYFAFRCLDTRADRIKASISARDKVRPDDWVCINLDTFNDQQSIYAFYVNPLGIQGDSRFEGGSEDYTIDVVWYSAGRIDPDGYSVEIRIPFKSIRLSDGDPVTMGVIFERMINRLSQSGTTPALDPRHGENFLTQTRPLVLPGIRHYRLVELLPSLTLARNRASEAGRLVGDPLKPELGLTAKVGLTSRLVLDATVNPDFSQVEADAGQVDFNQRFALFYPETRPFFLEGLEKYNFGAGDSDGILGEVVHTRTIIDPAFGLKLNGNLSRRDMIASIFALDALPDGSARDYDGVGILRYKRALAHDGFIGGFITDRERTDGFNRVAGIDGQIRLAPPSLLSFYAFGSATRDGSPAETREGHAAALNYSYQTRDWMVGLLAQDIGRSFETETGYLTRNGLTRLKAGLGRILHFDSGFFLRIIPLVHTVYIRDAFSGLDETANSLDVRFLLRGSSSFSLGGKISSEIFEAKRFSTTGLRASGTLQFSSRLSLTFSAQTGAKIRYVESPYQGFGSDAAAALEYKPLDKLHFNLALSYSDFSRREGKVREFDYAIARGRATYQINRYLFLRAIVEYNSFRDELMTDFLASFTYIPGTVIHLGYGSLYEKLEWIEGEYRGADRFLESRRGFFFKASYLWRL